MTQAVYPKAIIEAWNGTSYDDISKDVVSEISCTYGIRGNDINDRVASVGELKFTLRNDTGCIGGVENYYTPNTLNTKLGWMKSIPIRLSFTYRTERVTKFTGHIAELNIDLENKRVEVLVKDWLDYAEKFPMKLMSYAENKNIGEVTDLILSGISIQPANKSYGIGSNTFTSIFDTVKNRTKALGEFQKLALSEMGFIYIRNDPRNGETLKVDGMTTRNGNAVNQVPTLDYLITQSLDYLITQSGDRLLIIEAQDADMNNRAYEVDFTYGDRIVNIINAKYYPRKIDTTEQVLYSLDKAIYLPAYGTTKIEVDYKDPANQSSSVAGKNMVNPVTTTDYLMNTLESGSGTDLTGNLIVSATYYATSISYNLTNSGATAGYITKLQARGYGIYLYNPTDYNASDNISSIPSYGELETSLDLKYLNDPTRAKHYADNLLSLLRFPAVNVNSFSFLANRSEKDLLHFMYLDCGDMLQIVDDKVDVTSYAFSYYYINGIEFTVTQGGLIKFTWIVVQANQNVFD